MLGKKFYVRSVHIKPRPGPRGSHNASYGFLSVSTPFRSSQITKPPQSDVFHGAF